MTQSSQRDDAETRSALVGTIIVCAILSAAMLSAHACQTITAANPEPLTGAIAWPSPAQALGKAPRCATGR